MWTTVIKFRSLVLTVQWHISMWTAVLHTQSSDPSYWPYSDTALDVNSSATHSKTIQIPRTDPTVTHLDVNSSDYTLKDSSDPCVLTLQWHILMWTTVIHPHRQFRTLVLTLQWHILMWTTVIHPHRQFRSLRTDPTVTHLDVNNSDTSSKTIQIPAYWPYSDTSWCEQQW